MTQRSRGSSRKKVATAKADGPSVRMNGSNGSSIATGNYRRFIENLPVLFYVVDSKPPYSPLYVSPAFERFGYPLEDWLNDPDMWLRVIHPEDREWVFNQTLESTSSGKEVDYEYRVFAKSGEMHWVRDRGCLIRDENGEVICREGIMLDITARIRTEEELKHSEEKYRNLFENANDIIYVHDLDGNYISLNLAAERVFGYSREEAMALNMAEVVVPEHLKMVREKLRQKICGDAEQTAYELDCVKKDGSQITLEVNSTVIRKNGLPIAVQGIARDITERKQTEEEIRDREQRYRDLFENANDLIYTHDLKGNFTSLNRAGERITGYSRNEALQMNIAMVVAPESLAAAREMTAKKLAKEAATTYETEIIAKNGRRVSLELSTRLIFSKGVPVGVQGIGRDITERRRAGARLKDSERRFRQLGEGIYHQVWTAEPNGKLDYVNERTMAYFGRSAEELIDGGWRDAIHPDDLEQCERLWESSIHSGRYFEMQFRLRRKDGTFRWHIGRANPGLDPEGNIIKWYGTNTDIDDQKQSEAKLNHIARHDPLTDLPNRIEFMSHLRSAVERARTNQVARFAVLFLDLDRFKVINDSLGHIVGDKLLTQIAERLNKLVRPGDVVARLGGDEFTILLNRTGGRDDVVRIAERVQRNISKAFMIDGYEVFTSASIGIIVSDEIMREPEDFLRDADSAMYRAKESGKARYEIFDSEMHVRNMNLLQIETELRHAVERGEFEVHYQPIVDLSSGTINEFEALIRWRHPQMGLVSPDDFISVAEESGMIVPIGQWILGEACRQLAKWQRKVRRPLSVSVNLSAKQLMHPALINQIQSILRSTGLQSRHLKLEVTESTVMEHSERSLSVLKRLAAMGVSLSTDDFGTGYSSLSYLQEFPFDRLKIDRSFIHKMNCDDRSGAIVRTILMLAANLGLDAVAEGIETENQLAALRSLGCRLGQGYYFSRPVNAAEARKLLTMDVSRLIDPQNTEVAGSIPLFEVSNIQ